MFFVIVIIFVGPEGAKEQRGRGFKIIIPREGEMSQTGGPFMGRYKKN